MSTTFTIVRIRVWAVIRGRQLKLFHHANYENGICQIGFVTRVFDWNSETRFLVFWELELLTEISEIFLWLHGGWLYGWFLIENERFHDVEVYYTLPDHSSAKSRLKSGNLLCCRYWRGGKLERLKELEFLAGKLNLVFRFLENLKKCSVLIQNNAKTNTISVAKLRFLCYRGDPIKEVQCQIKSRSKQASMAPITMQSLQARQKPN